jgi:hypothetical protein
MRTSRCCSTIKQHDIQQLIHAPTHANHMLHLRRVMYGSYSLTHVTGVLMEMEMPPMPRLLLPGELAPLPPSALTDAGDVVWTDQG